MTGFSADWLALREPADRAARSATVIDWLAPVLKRDPLRILDLAAGTASNLRYLAPQFGGAQQWVLADHDQALLDAVPTRLREWVSQLKGEVVSGTSGLRLRAAGLECDIERLHVDLAKQLDTIDFGRFDLVTAAALLDLVSVPWLHKLVSRCKRAGCTLLLALSYDGRMEFDPADTEDHQVRALVNAHQRTDKGFGPALGPKAASRITHLLREEGYEVLNQHSDWRIDALQPQLQRELIAGWASASVAMAPEGEAQINDWRDRRLAHVAAGHSHLLVGHVDVAARPGLDPTS